MDPLKSKKVSALEEKEKYIPGNWIRADKSVQRNYVLLRLCKRYARITKTPNLASRNRVTLQKLVK